MALKNLASVGMPMLAVALSAVILGSSALTASAQGPQPFVPGPDHCLLVKNSEARKMCQYARAQYYQGNYRGALPAMQKAVALSPREGIMRVVLSFILVRYESLGVAEREARQARQDGAPDHIALPQLFAVMIRRHEEINLLNEFPEPAAGAKDAVASDIWQGRGRALESLGRLPEAAVAMDHSLSLSRDADGLLVRSKIALKQNDPALAGKLADEAYRLEPKTAAVMVAKLGQLERANDTAGVLALSSQMIKLYPAFSDPVVFRVNAFLKQNQDAKAKAEVEAYLARRPRAGVGLYYRAVLLSRAKDKKGAAQIIQTFPLQFVRDYPEFGLQMAQIAFDNGNTEIAAGILGAGLGAAPDRTDMRLKLAELRLAQDAPQAAQLLLRPVEDSKDPRVQKLVGQVRARIAKDRAF